MPDVLQKAANWSPTDITLVTTAETVIISSPAVKLPSPTPRIVIKAWAQLTTSGSTTTVTPRIRRGTLITDPLVGEANAENVKAAAGSTEPFQIAASELLGDQDQVIYSLTLQQAGAAANGTSLQAMIEVEVLND